MQRTVEMGPRLVLVTGSRRQFEIMWGDFR